MFISYRKMAQGFAAFVLATGIMGIALTAGNTSPKSVEPQEKLSLKQEHAVPAVPDTIKQVSTPSIQKVSSRGSEVKPKEDFKYKVIQGDTLYGLAIKYGISTDEIMLASKIQTDKLSLDQELIIPVSGKYKKLAALKRSTEAAAAKKVTTQKRVASRNEKNTSAVVKATTSNIRSGEVISWQKVSSLFPRGATAKVIDVDTGLTFRVKRLQGTYHADSEPLTANDTAVLKRLYGGSWSWSRRAVVVVVNGKYIAASINGMPHGEDSIRSNNFAGHICIHFKDSKTHGSSYTKSGKPVVDSQHQAMVRKASGR